MLFPPRTFARMYRTAKGNSFNPLISVCLPKAARARPAAV
jgi:hypothetical protein